MFALVREPRVSLAQMVKLNFFLLRFLHVAGLLIQLILTARESVCTGTSPLILFFQVLLVPIHDNMDPFSDFRTLCFAM